MPRKTFNSDSARKLAQLNKIKLGDIPTTRSDNKITIQNIKDYLKSIKRTKPAVSPRTPVVSPRTRETSPVRRTTPNVKSRTVIQKPSITFVNQRTGETKQIPVTYYIH